MKKLAALMLRAGGGTGAGDADLRASTVEARGLTDFAEPGGRKALKALIAGAAGLVEGLGGGAGAEGSTKEEFEGV